MADGKTMCTYNYGRVLLLLSESTYIHLNSQHKPMCSHAYTVSCITVINALNNIRGR